MAHPTRRRSLLCALLVLSVGACTSGDPKTSKYWVDKAHKERSEREKRADLGHLAALLKSGKQAGASAQVATLLKDQPGDVVQDAAQILGDLGDASAVPALVDAIDLSRGAGSDHATEAINHANKAIAQALGELGEKSAVPGLIKLLKSKDNYTVLAAISALGDLRDPAAVAPLSQVATDGTIEPLVVKKAIMALGAIGDPKGIPAVHKMLYKERTDRGISFFAESSFALYQIGPASADVLLSDVSGKDKAFLGWAKDNGVLPGAVYAKSAQILGDLAEPRSQSALLKLLDYKDGDLRMQYVTRMQAADALGRMHEKAAVKPLTEMLFDDEANARATFCRALSFIGDHAAVPALLKSAATGSFAARQFAFKALALLGNAGDAKAYDALLEGEPKREKAECADQEIGDADCAEQIKKNLALLEAYKAPMAVSCPAADACWAAHLADKSVFVQQRAALELGRSAKATAVPLLFAAVQKPLDGATMEAVTEQDNARFAAILGLHWLLDAGIKPADAAKMAATLEAQAEKERKKTATQRSAEDVKRLAVSLTRA